MTQDQYGQAKGPGNVVRGDVVTDAETEEFPTGQSKPMTRFEKVASALPGGDPDLDEAVAVTSPHAPDAEDHQATQPDMFGIASDPTYGNLIPDAAQYTEQWQRIQFKFVDDPHAAVTEAADIIAQVTAKLEAAIAERQRSLRGRWGEGANADTEALRQTLRMYRTFLHQLIGPRAG
jgi:hypothetical protein